MGGDGREKRLEEKLIRWKFRALSADNSNFITGTRDYDFLEMSSKRGLVKRTPGNFRNGIANCKDLLKDGENLGM